MKKSFALAPGLLMLLPFTMTGVASTAAEPESDPVRLEEMKTMIPV